MKKFKDVAEEWYEYYSECVKSITLEGHKQRINKFVVKYGDMSINEITKLDLQQFVANLNKRGYAKETIKKHKLSVQLVFDYAIDKGIVNFNPAYKIKIPKNAPVTERTAISDEEILIVNQSVYKHDLGLLALFLLYTGVRRSEALALCYEDIDLEKNYISINKILTYEAKEPTIVKKLKNGSTERRIPILNPLKPYLSELCASQKKGLVFSINGEPYTKSYITSRWKSYQYHTGIKATQHQFRHTFATLAYDAGVDAKVTQSLLGHKSLKMTLDVYTHIGEKQKQKGELCLNEYLSNMLNL